MKYKQYKILKDVKTAVDLGAAPGSWSQYLVKRIRNGKIVSIDLLKFETIKNTHQIIGDFTDEIYKKDIKNYFKDEVDIVVSDMAVNTTGNKNLDAIVTGELCLEAMKFALEILKKKGKFVSKIFMGSSFNEIVEFAKKSFIEVRVFKPSASKKDSKENFIICKFLR